MIFPKAKLRVTTESTKISTLGYKLDKGGYELSFKEKKEEEEEELEIWPPVLQLSWHICLAYLAPSFLTFAQYSAAITTTVLSFSDFNFLPPSLSLNYDFFFFFWQGY